MKYSSFWDTLQQPVIGLAPMDGVTDVLYRTMYGIYGRKHKDYEEFIEKHHNPHEDDQRGSE